MLSFPGGAGVVVCMGKVLGRETISNSNNHGVY